MTARFEINEKVLMIEGLSPETHLIPVTIVDIDDCQYLVRVDATGETLETFIEEAMLVKQ